MSTNPEIILADALATKEQMDKLTLLGDKAYVCLECGQISDYYKFGGVCERCEARGERQMEQERGN